MQAEHSSQQVTVALNGFDTRLSPNKEDVSAPLPKGGDGREILWGGNGSEHPHGEVSPSQLSLPSLRADLLRH